MALTRRAKTTEALRHGDGTENRGLDASLERRDVDADEEFEPGLRGKVDTNDGLDATGQDHGDTETRRWHGEQRA
jgi:hypothetical protein